MVKSEEEDREDFNVLKDMKSGNIELSVEDHIMKFISNLFIMGGVLFLLMINFVSLSCCLTINKDVNMSGKIVGVIFSFLFGFIYFTIFILGNHIKRKNKTINFDSNNLFPF
jgi:hypothetical protein